MKTSTGYRNIEDIRAGDKVLSYNEHTRRLEVQTVAQTFILKTSRINTLIYDTGTKLQTTATHPCYVIEGKGWVKAADLHVGDDSLLSREVSQLDVYGGARLQNVSYRQSKQGVIAGIIVEDRAKTVYNFEGNETHTYLVGDADVVVVLYTDLSHAPSPLESIVQSTNTRNSDQRSIRRRSEGSDGKHVSHEEPGVDEHRIIVVDDVFRDGLSSREGFFQILSYPVHRMSRNVYMQNLSGRMMDDKEDVERRKVPHRYYEEIHGCNLRGMKVDKVLPVPSGSLCSFRHVFANGMDMQAIARHL